jgi:hypothetical protein
MFAHSRKIFLGARRIAGGVGGKGFVWPVAIRAAGEHQGRYVMYQPCINRNNVSFAAVVSC